MDFVCSSICSSSESVFIISSPYRPALGAVNARHHLVCLGVSRVCIIDTAVAPLRRAGWLENRLRNPHGTFGQLYRGARICVLGRPHVGLSAGPRSRRCEMGRVGSDGSLSVLLARGRALNNDDLGTHLSSQVIWIGFFIFCSRGVVGGAGWLTLMGPLFIVSSDIFLLCAMYVTPSAAAWRWCQGDRVHQSPPCLSIAGDGATAMGEMG